MHEPWQCINIAFRVSETFQSMASVSAKMCSQETVPDLSNAMDKLDIKGQDQNTEVGLISRT